MTSKLIRDKIPEIAQANGDELEIVQASDAQYWEKLKEKLREEADEFIESESEEELADILEVLYAIYEFKRIDKSYIEHLRKIKAAKRGAFSKRLLMKLP